MPKITNKKLLNEQSFITKCIFKGMSNEQIAKELKYSTSTISNRMTVLFKKYNAKTRFEFVLGILAEVIKNHKNIINKTEDEIERLNERIEKAETILLNIIKSENDRQSTKIWIKNAQKYLSN